MVTVAAYVAQSSAQPFVWGQTDCMLWCATLVAARRGDDPAADLRGTYDSAFGARRIVMAAGGLRALSRQRMGPPDPVPGADGVCVARWRGQTICGIRSAGHLILKTPGGVMLPEGADILDYWKL